MSPSPHSTSEKFPASLPAMDIAAALDKSQRDEETVSEYLSCMLAGMDVPMEKVEGCVLSEKESAEQTNVRLITKHRISKSGGQNGD